MEWIRISSNKLKIMLTAEDARRYDLRCEKADYADVATRHSFREILTDVRRETGFDATEDKVYIQMYPSKEGGCELFVTKIGLVLAEEKRENPKPARTRSTGERRSTQHESLALLFHEMRHLLAVCRHLCNIGFSCESEAWLSEDGKLWLLLTQKCNTGVLQDCLRVAREYGRPTSVAAARLYLPEHGKRICAARAVETLGRL